MSRMKFKNSYLSYVMVYFFYFFSMGVFGSILSLYLAGNGKTSTEISFIVSGSGIISIFMQPVMGAVYDRLKKDQLVSIILLALSVATGVIFALTQMTWLLFLLNGFSMAFLNSVNPVAERMATESKFRYGTIRLWGAVGYAVSTQVAGLVFDYISPSFNFVLFAVGGILTAVGFIGAGGGKQTAKTEKKTDKPVSTKEALRSLLTNKPFIIFAVMSFLFSGAAGANSTYLPLLLEESLGSVTVTGTILFLGTMMELPIIICSNKYMDQLSNKALLCIDFGLLVAQFLCYSLSSVSWLICLVLFLCKSTATMLFIMVTLKVVLNITDENTSTTALSIIATVKTLGNVVITYLGGFLSDNFGLGSVFFMLLVASAAGLLMAFVLKLPSKNKELFGG